MSNLALLAHAAAAVDALDMLAEASTQLAPLATQPVRQIDEHLWEMGEQYLRDNPTKDVLDVHFYHWVETMRWEFKVARATNAFVRQTWLNGVLLDSQSSRTA
jgi:hypothetical protein